MLAGGESSSVLSRAVTNFDDIDEEDRAGRKTRLFKRNETQGYIDTASLDAASVDKVFVFYRLPTCARISDLYVTYCYTAGGFNKATRTTLCTVLDLCLKHFTIFFALTKKGLRAFVQRNQTADDPSYHSVAQLLVVLINDYPQTRSTAAVDVAERIVDIFLPLRTTSLGRRTANLARGGGLLRK